MVRLFRRILLKSIKEWTSERQKITQQETEGVPHHMIDIVAPDERFSVAAFKEKAEEIITDIYARGKLPMIVGGTMLWIDALLHNYQFPEETAPINDLAQENAAPTTQQASTQSYTNTQQELTDMQEELKQLDPKTYGSIDLDNPRRVARALAFVKKSGKSFIDEQKKQTGKYNHIILGLKWPKEELYERLNQRVDIQLDQGLLEEVRTIRDQYGDNSPGMQCISYRQMAWYLSGEMTLEEATTKLMQANRNYAKRQMTWWRRNSEIKWFDCN